MRKYTYTQSSRLPLSREQSALQYALPAMMFLIDKNASTILKGRFAFLYRFFFQN